MISLKDRTRQLLEESGLSDREVANVLGCSAQWVAYFRQKTVKSPNVDIIQRLYEHLTGEALLKD